MHLQLLTIQIGTIAVQGVFVALLISESDEGDAFEASSIREPEHFEGLYLPAVAPELPDRVLLIAERHATHIDPATADETRLGRIQRT